jgi:peptidoglycan/xylan/chitin deacetylase (PgdA/CDA1 family)
MTLLKPGLRPSAVVIRTGSWMKQRVLRLMQAAGGFAPFRLVNRSKVVIITYHRFAANDAPISTRVSTFAEQLDYLQDHYRVIALSELADYLQKGREVPPGLAVITVDDGYRDFYELAFPMLRRRGLPATLFVVSGFVDGETWLWTDKLRYLTQKTESRIFDAAIFEAAIHGRRFTSQVSGSRLEASARISAVLKSLPDESKDLAIKRIADSLGVELPERAPEQYAALSWDQIKEIAAAGIEIGSHTTTHPILVRVDRDRVRQELGGSKARLESVIGRKIDLFCYPNGDWNSDVRSEVARAGYRCAVTTESGLNGVGSDPMTLKRVPAEHDIAHFAQSTSGFELIKNQFARKRALAAGFGR